MAEGAARIDAVALEPVPAARAEPRALAVSELAIRPLQQKPQTHQRESENLINHQNQPMGPQAVSNSSFPVPKRKKPRNGGTGLGLYRRRVW